MICVSLLMVALALGQTKGDEGDGGTKEVKIEVHLVADGQNGIRVDPDAELLRMGDRIKATSVHTNGQPMCTQYSRGRKKVRTERCGFLGLQSCPVYETRDQKCGVLADCNYLLMRSDQKQELCDATWKGSVVGVTMNFAPAVRGDICRASCDQTGWTTIETRAPISTLSGVPLGTAEIVVDRPY